ncbi:hypothetical protein B0H17DRAFT_1144875 [Mycena rosella]|uniref:Uncharacterized protein n=1 Tax=Mycena rosella TaxID=1033263 RepID=A0AAD7CS56_MYCRO|nr:hypothetical protein B0H17DRAFT_1144875 [Mycena rosella]
MYMDDVNSWARAREEERSGKGAIDASTVWPAQVPVTVWWFKIMMSEEDVKVREVFSDEPEKKISYLSIKTLTNYLCGVRGEQHLKKDRTLIERDIRESFAGQEPRPRTRSYGKNQGDGESYVQGTSRTIAWQRGTPEAQDSELRSQKSRSTPEPTEILHIAGWKTAGSKDRRNRHWQSRDRAVREVVVVVMVRKKDLESHHINRSTADAAVELAYAKKAE